MKNNALYATYIKINVTLPTRPQPQLTEQRLPANSDHFPTKVGRDGPWHVRIWMIFNRTNYKSKHLKVVLFRTLLINFGIWIWIGKPTSCLDKVEKKKQNN